MWWLDYLLVRNHKLISISVPSSGQSTLYNKRILLENKILFLSNPPCANCLSIFLFESEEQWFLLHDVWVFFLLQRWRKAKSTIYRREKQQFLSLSLLNVAHLHLQFYFFYSRACRRIVWFVVTEAVQSQMHTIDFYAAFEDESDMSVFVNKDNEKNRI